jgi:hypothetical protein
MNSLGSLTMLAPLHALATCAALLLLELWPLLDRALLFQPNPDSLHLLPLPRGPGTDEHYFLKYIKQQLSAPDPTTQACPVLASFVLLREPNY